MRIAVFNKKYAGVRSDPIENESLPFDSNLYVEKLINLKPSGFLLMSKENFEKFVAILAKNTPVRVEKLFNS